MTIYQNALWGYQLSIPNSWVHRDFSEVVGFGPNPDAFQSGYVGSDSGHLLVRGEWNATGQEIEPLWTQHIAKLAGIIGAKQVGSAPWQMGGGTGLEAEIVLPKRENKRLWTGILTRGLTVLHFMVMHDLDEKDSFEPVASQVISSLAFIGHVKAVIASEMELPLPPGYTPTDPTKIVSDIPNPNNWKAYDGNSSMGALQSFYLREAIYYGWQISSYLPYPGDTDLGFARLRLQKGSLNAMLGIMPGDVNQSDASSSARIVIKYSTGIN
jgi:hypothetical protein